MKTAELLHQPWVLAGPSMSYSTLDAPYWQYYGQQLQPSSYNGLTLQAGTGGDHLEDLSIAAIYDRLLHPDDSSPTQGTMMDPFLTPRPQPHTTAHGRWSSAGPQTTTTGGCSVMMTTPAGTGGENDDEGTASLLELLFPGAILPPPEETAAAMMDLDTATAEHRRQMAATSPGSSSLPPPPPPPPMAAVNSPSLCVPHGTLMATSSSSALLQEAMTTMYNMYNIVPQEGKAMTTDAVQRSPPWCSNSSAAVGLPQKATRRRRHNVTMDAEQKKALRLQQNKEQARVSRERNKAYVKDLESRLQELEEDNKKLLDKLQYLEIVCHKPLSATAPPVWLPYTAIDQLLQALNETQTNASLYNKLRDKLDGYHKLVEQTENAPYLCLQWLLMKLLFSDIKKEDN